MWEQRPTSPLPSLIDVTRVLLSDVGLDFNTGKIPKYLKKGVVITLFFKL